VISEYAGVGDREPPLTTPAADFHEMLDICEDVVSFIQQEVEKTPVAVKEVMRGV